MNELVAKAWDFIRGRKTAYQLVFNRTSPAVSVVLADLSNFCRANGSVFHPDQRMTDVLIGRQEVFRRIQDHLNLSSQDLYRLAAGQQLNLEEKPNE
jgi:hypothetical protein